MVSILSLNYKPQQPHSQPRIVPVSDINATLKPLENVLKSNRDSYIAHLPQGEDLNTFTILFRNKNHSFHQKAHDIVKWAMLDLNESGFPTLNDSPHTKTLFQFLKDLVTHYPFSDQEINSISYFIGGNGSVNSYSRAILRTLKSNISFHDFTPLTTPRSKDPIELHQLSIKHLHDTHPCCAIQ